ncbi:MAG: helix-turn-helix domain-containing protein [Actinomycetes bacterium]
MTEHDARIDPRAHRVLADVSRVAVLETLRRARRPLSIPEIAAEVGLHPNTVRSHLALLVEYGYATGRTEDRDRPGRPRLLYAATSRPDDNDDRRNYRLLAEVLVGYLAGNEGAGEASAASAAIAAGRAYGGRIAGAARDRRALDPAEATRRVLDLLRDAGFDPRLTPDGRQIELRRCPFRELARSNADVVCGVHLGLMQGALAELGASLTTSSLRPFARPGVCVATLRPTEEAPPAPR